MENDQGFIKCYYGSAANELIKFNKNAFILLTIIAERTKQEDEVIITKHGQIQLNKGEALIGDYKKYDMTLSEYNTAKKI